MDYRKRIKQMRKERKWLQKQLASELGVTPEAVCYWESLQRHPRPHTLNQICELFNVTKAELFGAPSTTGEEVQEGRPNYDGFRVPMITWKLMDLYGDTQETEFSQFISTSVQGPNNFALTIDKDYMSPEFQKGDVIVINPDLKYRHGDYVVVRQKDDKIGFLRQFRRFGEEYVLRAINPQYGDITFNQDEHQVIGVVISKERFYVPMDYEDRD